MKYKRVFILLSVLILLLSACEDGGITDSNPDPDGEPTFSFDHEQRPGDSATDFLTNDDFENLIVEIDYMEGYEPTDEAVNSLQSFLEARLNKGNITVQEPTSVSAAGQDSYSDSDVRNLEEEHRDNFSEENSIVAYLIILDGEYEQSNVLGIAYYNTSMALFGETIDNVSGGIDQNPQNIVEATVMHHEFGHILGLVDNGVDMQQDHQDDQNGHHCTVEECLMYYSVRTTDFFASILGGEVPDLDDQCKADLQAAGGK